MIPFAGRRALAATAAGGRDGRNRRGQAAGGRCAPRPGRSETAGPRSWARWPGDRSRPALGRIDGKPDPGWAGDVSIGIAAPGEARPDPRSTGAAPSRGRLGTDFHPQFGGPNCRKIGYRHHYRNHRDGEFGPFRAFNRDIRQTHLAGARSTHQRTEIRGSANRRCPFRAPTRPRRRAAGRRPGGVSARHGLRRPCRRLLPPVCAHPAVDARDRREAALAAPSADLRNSHNLLISYDNPDTLPAREFPPLQPSPNCGCVASCAPSGVEMSTGDARGRTGRDAGGSSAGMRTG